MQLQEEENYADFNSDDLEEVKKDVSKPVTNLRESDLLVN